MAGTVWLERAGSVAVAVNAAVALVGYCRGVAVVLEQKANKQYLASAPLEGWHC